MMEIKVIGSGSSGNCYLVTDAQTRLLLDVGLSIEKIKQGVGRLSEIDGALVTHKHKDHSKSIDKVIAYGIRVWANQDTLDDACLSNNYKAKTVGHGSKFSIGSFNVAVFQLQHDVDCVGYWLHSTLTKETLVFITDTMFCEYQFKNVNYWIIECNYDEETIQEKARATDFTRKYINRAMHTHMSLETVLKMLEENDLTMTKCIYLAHLSDSNSNEERIIKSVQEATGKLVKVC